MTTPGILDPELFGSYDEFLKVMLRNGLAKGWTPISSISAEQSARTEDFLVHYGVKGMHWGVRREHSSSDIKTELERINRKIDKIDADKALRGYSLRGWAAEKQYKKEIRRNPNYDQGKLTEAEREEFEKKATRKVTRSVIERGVIEAAIVLAGGTLVSNKIGGSPQAKLGTEVSLIILAGQLGRMRISELNSIRTGKRLEELQRRRDALGGRPK